MTDTDLKSKTLEELRRELTASGIQKYRADQLYQWMHVKMAPDYESMTNIPKSLKELLTLKYEYITLKEIRRQVSKVDGTEKYLFELPDGNLVESVLMRYKFGNSICVSSQVGCRMGCRFCASTLNGLERNLTPSEILEQIYSIERRTGQKVSHVVVMGTGEPMDNYENVVRFIRLLSDENGHHLSQRNITVSTCGIVPGILALAKEDLSINLALSLHATTDEKRRKIMPVAERYTIEELMDAMGTYFKSTGRQVTFEYSLIRGVNDTNEDAWELSELASKISALVNLIPVNPVVERSFVQPTNDEAKAFKAKLEKRGIHVTIRREMGRDIDGACGQLRRRYLGEETKA